MSTPLLQKAPGKRIALPTRVEPKVFFANERTFLSWLNFTVMLGGLGVGLLNFGDKVGQISAGLFTLVAMGTMIYALVTYHWRAAAIRRRGSGPYDDRFGPTLLCFFLLVAVVVNFFLKMKYQNNDAWMSAYLSVFYQPERLVSHLCTHAEGRGLPLPSALACSSLGQFNKRLPYSKYQIDSLINKYGASEQASMRARALERAIHSFSTIHKTSARLTSRQSGLEWLLG